MTRCYAHVTAPFAQANPALREVVDAFSPDLGRLWVATEEEVKATSGCTQSQAEALFEALGKVTTR